MKLSETWDENRIRYTLAASMMPTEKDSEDFTAYFLGVLLNYVDEDTVAYAIGQAYNCWAELNGEKPIRIKEAVN